MAWRGASNGSDTHRTRQRFWFWTMVLLLLVLWYYGQTVGWLAYLQPHYITTLVDLTSGPHCALTHVVQFPCIGWPTHIITLLPTPTPRCCGWQTSSQLFIAVPPTLLPDDPHIPTNLPLLTFTFFVLRDTTLPLLLGSSTERTLLFPDVCCWTTRLHVVHYRTITLLHLHTPTYIPVTRRDYAPAAPTLHLLPTFTRYICCSYVISLPVGTRDLPDYTYRYRFLRATTYTTPTPAPLPSPHDLLPYRPRCYHPFSTVAIATHWDVPHTYPTFTFITVVGRGAGAYIRCRFTFPVATPHYRRYVAHTFLRYALRFTFTVTHITTYVTFRLPFRCTVVATFTFTHAPLPAFYTYGHLVLPIHSAIYCTHFLLRTLRCCVYHLLHTPHFIHLPLLIPWTTYYGCCYVRYLTTVPLPHSISVTDFSIYFVFDYVTTLPHCLHTVGFVLPGPADTRCTLLHWPHTTFDWLDQWLLWQLHWDHSWFDPIYPHYLAVPITVLLVIPLPLPDSRYGLTWLLCITTFTPLFWLHYYLFVTTYILRTSTLPLSTPFIWFTLPPTAPTPCSPHFISLLLHYLQLEDGSAVRGLQLPAGCCWVPSDYFHILLFPSHSYPTPHPPPDSLPHSDPHDTSGYRFWDQFCHHYITTHVLIGLPLHLHLPYIDTTVDYNCRTLPTVDYLYRPTYLVVVQCYIYIIVLLVTVHYSTRTPIHITGPCWTVEIHITHYTTYITDLHRYVIHYTCLPGPTDITHTLHCHYPILLIWCGPSGPQRLLTILDYSARLIDSPFLVDPDSQ